MSDAKSRVTVSTQGRVSRIMQKVKHDKYNTKCVCEICTCGIHRCPPNQRRRFQGHTTNQDFYQPYRIEPDKDEAPVYKVKQRHYDPEALQTTYNTQYTPKKSRVDADYGRLDKDLASAYKVKQRHYDPEALQTTYNTQYTPKRSRIDAGELGRSVEYLPRKTPFYSETEYNTKFVRRSMVAEQPEPKYEYKPNRAKFEGVTSYNAQFTPKKPEKNLDNPQVAYKPKNIPFHGESAYKQQFKRYSIAAQKPDQYVYRPNTAKFIGESRYHEDFHPYAKSNYVNAQENCAINELPAYPAVCSPGKRHLNYSAEKNYWE